MNHLEFLQDRSWDFPFFKRLASNDTGAAPGHQAGLVIVKPLRSFFPTLTGEPSPEHPTIEHYVRALLTVAGKPVDLVTTRYQIQSWRGTRRPETRLTGQLGAIRNIAQPRDYLVIQRSIEDLNLYRLTLIQQDTPIYNAFAQLVSNRPWGLVEKHAPVAETDIIEAETAMHKQEMQPFQMFDTEVEVIQTRTKRLARSIVFQKTIKHVYKNACCLCGKGLKSPLGPLEVDAAHIIPKRRSGSDDPRNGLALCKRDHWAFDNGLFAIDQNRKVFVPKIVRQIKYNKVLTELNGHPIKEANDPNLVADPCALKWHKDNILLTEDG